MSGGGRSRIRLLVLAAAGMGILGGLRPSGLGGQETPIPLDTLTVLGSRAAPELPVRTRAIQILDRSVLERTPGRTVADVLRWAVGVELGERSPAQADLSLRGAGFEQVLVLVNGVRMTDPQTGHFNLNLTVPLDRIERIEILRGPASAVYGGDAVGGVVNVVTRSSPGWSASVEGGSFGTRSGSVNAGVPLGGGVQVRGGGEWSRSDGHREGTDHDLRQGSLEAAAPMGGGRLLAEAGAARRAFGADHFYAPFPSYETSSTGTASLSWRPGAEARVQVRPRVSWRRHDDDFILVREDPGVYRNEHRSTQWSGEVVVRARPVPVLSLVGGGELGLDDLESSNLGDRSEARWALFMETAADPDGPLSLSGGLRLDHHEAWGAFLSPSASAALRLTPTVRLRASGGRAFRAPTWTERYYVDPAHEARADLEPERSRSVEVGVDLSLPAGVAARVTGFRRNSRDLIDWARPGTVPEEEAVWQTRNVNRSRFRGLEAELSAGLWQGIGVELSGTLLSLASDAREGLESKYALRPQTEQVVLDVHRTLGGGATATLRALHGRRPGDPAFRRIDLRVAVPLLGGAVHVDGTNLANASHPDLTGNPVAGRALFVGFRTGGP